MLMNCSNTIICVLIDSCFVCVLVSFAVLCLFVITSSIVYTLRVIPVCLISCGSVCGYVHGYTATSNAVASTTTAMSKPTDTAVTSSQPMTSLSTGMPTIAHALAQPPLSSDKGNETGCLDPS